MTIASGILDRFVNFLAPTQWARGLCVVLLAITTQAYAAERFDDRCDQPVALNVRSGSWIDGIELVCANGWQFPRGGSGGVKNEFVLQPGEIITGISGTKNAPGYPFVMSLQIHSNLRHSPIYGADPNLVANDQFSFSIYDGVKFTGLVGVAGDYLDDLIAINIDPVTQNMPPPEPQNNAQYYPPASTSYAAVRVMNLRPEQIAVYIDDPQAGLVAQFVLANQASQEQSFPVGTKLVFALPGGAPVSSYTVDSNPSQRVDLVSETHPSEPASANAVTRAPVGCFLAVEQNRPDAGRELWFATVPGPNNTLSYYQFDTYSGISDISVRSGPTVDAQRIFESRWNREWWSGDDVIVLQDAKWAKIGNVSYLVHGLPVGPEVQRNKQLVWTNCGPGCKSPNYIAQKTFTQNDCRNVLQEIRRRSR